SRLSRENFTVVRDLMPLVMRSSSTGLGWSASQPPWASTWSSTLWLRISARDVGAVGGAGGRGGALHQRRDDVAFLHQDGGGGLVLLRPQRADDQCRQHDRGEDQPQRNAPAAAFLQQHGQQGLQ